MGDGAPRRVARSDRDVGAGLDGGEQFGDHLGLVGQVGVDLHEHVVVACHAEPEAGAVGLAEAVLGRAPEDLDASQLVRDPLCDLRGAVGAGVVDDEDVGFGHACPHPPQEFLDVLGLLVGRRDDQHAHGAVTYLRSCAQGVPSR